MAIDTTMPRTRRAILMGALGGVAASVAAAVGRASPVGAANNDAVLVGGYYESTATTTIHALNGATAVDGVSEDGLGVSGHSSHTFGVAGTSGGDFGVTGQSNDYGGVYGKSLLSVGVQGYSGPDQLPPGSPANTGVFGSASRDETSVGVRGGSSTGRGAVFNGKLAQLRLNPSSAATHPASGAPGDLFFDKSHRLWLCKSGTIWVKLA